MMWPERPAAIHYFTRLWHWGASNRWSCRVISNSRKKHNHRPRFGAINIGGNRLCCLPSGNVVRRVEPCVNPASPWIVLCIIQSRQFKIESLPIGVQDEVGEHLLPSDFHC